MTASVIEWFAHRFTWCRHLWGSGFEPRLGYVEKQLFYIVCVFVVPSLSTTSAFIPYYVIKATNLCCLIFIYILHLKHEVPTYMFFLKCDGVRNSKPKKKRETALITISFVSFWFWQWVKFFNYFLIWIFIVPFNCSGKSLIY